MKIGLVIYGNLGISTGGYLYDRMLVDHLRKEGDHVDVISLPVGSYIKHIRDNYSPLYRKLVSANYDILLEDELNHPSLFSINHRLKKRINYPIISIIHHLSYSAESNWIKRILYGMLEKKYLTSIDGFVFNSRTNKKVVESFIGDNVNSVVAYPGRDHIKSTVMPKDITLKLCESEKFHILFVGNLVRHKCIHTIIEAISNLDDDKVILNIVGNLSISPSYVKSLRKLVYSLGLNSRVNILGFLSNHKLNQYFRDCHVFTLPSIYEGFGIAYLEALGFGLPIIASTEGAAREIIKDGIHGYLVEPELPIALAKKLSILISDRELLQKMSLNALNHYRKFPLWSESMSKIRNFLTSF